MSVNIHMGGVHIHGSTPIHGAGWVARRSICQDVDWPRPWRCFYPLIDHWWKQNKTTGWWFGTWILFSHILGKSSSQLTFIFFRRGCFTTNQKRVPEFRCDFDTLLKQYVPRMFLWSVVKLMAFDVQRLLETWWLFSPHRSDCPANVVPRMSISLPWAGRYKCHDRKWLCQREVDV